MIIRLNHGNVRKVLRSQAVADAARKKVVSVLPPGFEATTFVGSNRVRVILHPVTDEAKAAQSEDPNILKNAIKAARG